MPLTGLSLGPRQVAASWTFLRHSSSAGLAGWHTTITSSTFLRHSSSRTSTKAHHPLVSPRAALQIVTDPATGRSKGYGFVRFTVEAERDRALGEMNGYPLNGRNLRCR